MKRPASNTLHLAGYWPHAGIAAGLILNAIGLANGQGNLIATGSNVLVICGLFLGQRRKNRD